MLVIEKIFCSTDLGFGHTYNLKWIYTVFVAYFPYSEQRLVHILIVGGLICGLLMIAASRRGVMLETASIASGASVAVFVVFVVCAYVYVQYNRKQKQNRAIR